ncbi:MAG TPA: Asp-tRNA(Asn)/Glu-tRNA(Gln) amidotransferase subunit GatA [Polyangiaceae bacterium]|nr:Asp-tRNA(Asn)/Glu-tRNA(Gln) amidotransferase subunit GatA [Polyangiaceae bacterium]
MSEQPQNCIDIAARVSAGELSATTVTEQYLERSRARASLNAFVYLAEREALQRAAELDAKRARGEALGRLAGVPIAIKDAICTRGMSTTAGSRILSRTVDGVRRGWEPPFDATVVQRLLAEGAVVIGKTNMDEFAMGSSNENSSYGPVKNPADETRIPGGSSGGSAAAVAAGLAPASLGSDTGGSIRQPASLCGVVGVKPTFGRVSRYGLVAYASSLDQIGPMTPDVASSARLLEILAGADGRDSTASAAPVGQYEAACARPIAGLRIGLPRQYFGDGLDAGVRAVLERALSALRDAGAQVVELDLPHTDYGVATYYVLATAEASSNLSRFDGVRFGLRSERSGGDLAELYSASRGEGFGAEVKRRILLGTYVLSAGYYDAYYGKAQRVRTLIRRDFDEAFRQVDVLFTPASPTAAFKLGEKNEDPLSMYLADVFTLPASLAGIPGLSVPVGAVDVDGSRLPVGAQLLGPHLGEEQLFRVAAELERSVGRS